MDIHADKRIKRKSIVRNLTIEKVRKIELKKLCDKN